MATISDYARARPRNENGSFRTGGGRVYDWLLEFPSVKSWIDAYTAPTSRRNYLLGLNVVCRQLNLNPDQILELARRNGDKVPHDLKSRFLGLTNSYVQGGKLGEARKVQVALRSFLQAHEISFVLTRQQQVRYRRKKVATEQIPKPEQVYAMADSADRMKGWADPLKRARAKAMILCHFQSGVRPSCLCRWTFGMVKDYLYPEVKSPIPLKITSTLDTKLLGYDLDYYYTFIGAEAANALRSYLDLRINRGAKLGDHSALFVTHSSNLRDTPLTYGDYFRIVHKLAKEAGIQIIWPHLIRKSFRKILNRSELDDDSREALMGHRIPGSRENYFDRHDLAEVTAKYQKCDFSRAAANTVDEMRKRYEELEDKMRELKSDFDQKLETIVGLQEDTLVAILRAYGYSAIEAQSIVNQMKGSPDRSDEIVEEARAKSPLMRMVQEQKAKEARKPA